MMLRVKSLPSKKHIQNTPAQLTKSPLTTYNTLDIDNSVVQGEIEKAPHVIRYIYTLDSPGEITTQDPLERPFAAKVKQIGRHKYVHSQRTVPVTLVNRWSIILRTLSNMC